MIDPHDHTASALAALAGGARHAALTAEADRLREAAARCAADDPHAAAEYMQDVRACLGRAQQIREGRA